ncbi:hypothetical protein ACRAWG_36990 [Methylobacterium sp. P31]
MLFRIDPRPFQVALAQTQAQEAQAKAQLQFAQAEVSRTDTLADKGYASEQRLQQLNSNAASAAAQVQVAKAAIARQNLNLDYAVVNASFDGRASLSIINPGDLVIEKQTQLVTVVQLDPIDVQMALSSEDSEALREAMHDGPSDRGGAGRSRGAGARREGLPTRQPFRRPHGPPLGARAAAELR